MSRRIASTAFLALVLGTSMASANDGTVDSNNAYPAVGFYYVVYTQTGGSVETLGGCSGTLISKNVFLTAAHCTFWDTRLLAEDPSYERAEAWVSFDPVVLENDFRCYLQDIRYPGAADLPCDAAARNRPTFRRAHSTGITHPAYPELQELGDGSLAIREPLTPSNTDLGVLLLVKPVKDIKPLATAQPQALDGLDTSGVTLLGVGFGLNYHKSVPATPEQPGGDGPTNFLSEYGIRRIAEVGTIQMITDTRITPTQNNALGDDSVCYWDSGSPLFIARNGVVDKTVVGVLTGWANWCMGAFDPYQRVDTSSSVAFLDCVKAAPTALDACRCGIEEELGLCEGL